MNKKTELVAEKKTVDITKRGLTFRRGLTKDEWLRLGKQLIDLESGIQFWIGDWINKGKEKGWKWGKYEDALELTDYQYGTLANYASTARQVKFSDRSENLPYTHHELIANKIDTREQQIKWISKAEKNQLSVRELKSELNKERDSSSVKQLETCEVKDLNKLAQKDIEFGTIYADPPWDYNNKGTRASATDHYETTGTDWLKQLPVNKLTADKSHLHLWTTNAFIFEAKELLEAWGFEYKSMLVWVKPQMGIGNYWRVSHEILLLGVKGKLTFDGSIKSWVEADRTQHSAKPEKIRQKIEQVSPSPRLELFARNIAKDWAVWGNEVERNMFEKQIATIGG